MQDDQENPWPGFVDIMSSTLLVFVFLVIIQLLLIAGIGMKVGESVSKKKFEQRFKQVPAEAEASPETKAEASITLGHQPRALSESLSSTISDRTSLRINYSNLDTLPSIQGSLQVDSWIARNQQQLMARRIHISGFIGLKDLSISTSSLVSFNRVMAIRTRLIKQGIPADNIIVRIQNDAPASKPAKQGLQYKNAVIIEILP